MSTPISPRRLYALEDCEELLLRHSLEHDGAGQITVDLDLFAELVSIAGKARAWGA